MPTFSSMHQRDARMFVPCRNCASLSSLMGRPMCQSILADCGWLWYFDDFDDLMFDYMLKWPKSIGLKLSNRCWTLLHVSAYSAACCQQQRNSKKNRNQHARRPFGFAIASVKPDFQCSKCSSKHNSKWEWPCLGGPLAASVLLAPIYLRISYIKIIERTFPCFFFCGSGSLCKIINPGKEWTQPAVQYGLIHHHLVLRCRPSLCLNTSQHISTHLNTSQHISTHLNTSQHISTHLNTSQHIFTAGNRILEVMVTLDMMLDVDKPFTNCMSDRFYGGWMRMMLCKPLHSIRVISTAG